MLHVTQNNNVRIAKYLKLTGIREDRIFGMKVQTQNFILE